MPTVWTDLGVARLADAVERSDPQAIADALSLAEDTRSSAEDAKRSLLAELDRRTRRDHRIVGITGPPGAGKSSLAGALIRTWTHRGFGVGMIAVDPTSQRSGGSLLGDRIRLQLDPGARAFVRSMGAGRRVGGLAPATHAACAVLRAAFEWTIVETVGAGQSEIDVANVSDSVVLVLQPGSGDTIQLMKAGILEIPDLLVVHKWDLGAVALRAKEEIEAFFSAHPIHPGTWHPPVLAASARTEFGIEDLADAIEEHGRFLDRTGELERRRAAHRIAWALDRFERRYGTYGIDRLGGHEAARDLAAELDANALDCFSSLATRAGFSE